MPIAANLAITYSLRVSAALAAGGAGSKAAGNTWIYRRSTIAIPVNKAALSTAFQANVMVPLFAAMNIRYAAVTLFIRNLEDYTDAEQSFAVAGVGAIATDALPIQNAAVFTLDTALRGGNYRGFKRLAPLSEVDTTQDILVGAGLARWQAVQAAMALTWADATPNTWVPHVYSRDLSTPDQLPVALIVATPVTGVRLALNTGTVRKRRMRTIR